MYFVPEPPQLSHPIVPIPPQAKHACHCWTGTGSRWCSTTTVVVLLLELLLLLEDLDDDVEELEELEEVEVVVFVGLGVATFIFETWTPKLLHSPFFLFEVVIRDGIWANKMLCLLRNTVQKY